MNARTTLPDSGIVNFVPRTAASMSSHQLLWSTSYYQALNYATSSPFEASRSSTPSTSSANKISQYLSARRLSNFQNPQFSVPSWSWAACDVPISYEHKTAPQVSGFKVIACETSLGVSGAPYSNVTSGRLTVKGSLTPALDNYTFSSNCEAWSLVHRPDTQASAEVFSQIMAGERNGWVLQLTSGSGISSNKPKDPNWIETAPKGLLLVAEGEYYRRIRLSSIELHQNYPPLSGERKEQFSFYGGVKTITLI